MAQAFEMKAIKVFKSTKLTHTHFFTKPLLIDPDQEEFEDDLVSCPVCHCMRGVRHTDPKRTLHEPIL